MSRHRGSLDLRWQTSLKFALVPQNFFGITASVTKTTNLYTSLWWEAKSIKRGLFLMNCRAWVRPKGDIVLPSLSNESTVRDFWDCSWEVYSDIISYVRYQWTNGANFWSWPVLSLHLRRFLITYPMSELEQCDWSKTYQEVEGLSLMDKPCLVVADTYTSRVSISAFQEQVKLLSVSLGSCRSLASVLSVSSRFAECPYFLTWISASLSVKSGIYEGSHLDISNMKAFARPYCRGKIYFARRRLCSAWARGSTLVGSSARGPENRSNRFKMSER